LNKTEEYQGTDNGDGSEAFNFCFEFQNFHAKTLHVGFVGFVALQDTNKQELERENTHPIFEIGTKLSQF
jgi:hypothetical protein